MPLPLAFGNPGVGKKLSSIREDDEESDADDVSLAILRSESRATPTSARSISWSLDDKARPQKKELAGSVDTTNDSPNPSPKKSSQRNTNASSSAFTTKPSTEDAFLESDQRNDRASTSNVLPAYPATIQLDTVISDLGELRLQQKDILQRVSSSQEDLKETLTMLVDGLKSLAEAVKSSNAQHGESLSSLKVRLDVKVRTLSTKKGRTISHLLDNLQSSIENERKAMQAQIISERLFSANQKNSFEEKIDVLTEDKALFDFERVSR